MFTLRPLKVSVLCGTILELHSDEMLQQRNSFLDCDRFYFFVPFVLLAEIQRSDRHE
jgi:hypothetical protein